MAVPSTTGGSGAGTEVLRRTVIDGANNATTTLLTVPADHIYTIMSISICNNDGSAKNMSMTVKPDGSNSIVLIQGQSIPAEGSFVYSDKFVMTAGDVIDIYCASTVTDVYCSYIDQQFA